MIKAARCCRLDDLRVLRFRGPDVLRFLQGQLSQDMERLATADGASVLAGLHTPQGRTLAVMRLIRAQDDVLAVLPAELASMVGATLRRYVLRAKVTLAEDGALTPWGLVAHAEPLRTLPGASARIGTDRWLLLAATAERDVAPDMPTMTRADWHALDIAAGLPQVYTSTSGAFVAQMLNLDCIDAISFTKGCYTGQEVIARAHYRGRVKRRMQRFVSRAAVTLAPGDAGALADGRTFRAVDAVRHADGRCEFLAVTALHAAVTVDAAEEVPSGAVVDCVNLPLPYPLPE